MSATKQIPQLVVGVSASRGGFEAVQRLLSSLPNHSDMAFLLVQEPDPTHSGLLAEQLAQHTPLRVLEAEEDLPVEPNHVYVVRPDKKLGVENGKVVLSSPPAESKVHMPVDHLFRTIAKEYGIRSVAIALSGTSDDGISGLREVKSLGGLTIAQSMPSGEHASMPGSAMDSGLIDLLLDIHQMYPALERFCGLLPDASSELVKSGPSVRNEEEPPSTRRPERLSKLQPDELASLAAILETERNFDLRVYKPATIQRRVLRRLALSGFGDIESYLDYLESCSEEQQILVRDLLIGVTEFFRDPLAFRELRERALEPLVQAAPRGTTLRAWVPGCATGEEAYSLAIEFLDVIEQKNKAVTLQVFATDINQHALAFARAGIYPQATRASVSDERLEKYFHVLDGHGYQVRSVLRDVVSFSEQDLTKDPPFSRIHVVSCRNVLIYLNARTQRHVLRLLHFALEPDGHLMLSPSESTGSQKELFSTVSKGHRIYRKAGTSLPLTMSRARSGGERSSVVSERITPNSLRLPTGLDLARRAVVEAFAPPTLVVAEDGSIIFSHGDLERYVRLPQGDHPRFELGAMLRPELASCARAAIYKCRRTKELVLSLVNPGETTNRITIQARPAPNLGDGVVILSFESVDQEARPLTVIADRVEPSEHEAVVEQLEAELKVLREDLRHTVEELESSNEELRSSNEESMSMNEELQSANEELEATTEELRSLNEELTTVNSQLREKVEQLEHAHDDLNNFFASTKVATVFLDERLCIKRFTPAAEGLLGIDRSHLGLPISDLPRRELLQHALDSEAKAVFDDLSGKTRTIQLEDGRCVARSVLPYRTATRRIEGVVVTYSDVTALHTANDELTIRTERLELAWEAARGGVFEHHIPFDDTTYISDQWAQVLGYRREELAKFPNLVEWLAQQAHPDDRATLETAYTDVVEGRADRYSIELRFRHHAGHYIWVRKISKVLARDEHGKARHLLRMMIDITDFKHAERALKESEVRFRELADGLPLMVWVHDETGQQEYVNPAFCEFYGVSLEDVTGGRWHTLLHPDDAKNSIDKFFTAFRSHLPFHSEGRVKHADGSWRWIESWGRPRFAEDGEFRGYVGTSVDITERRKMETVLRESEERFRNLADNITQLAWTCDRLGSATWYNQRWYDYTGSSWEEMQGEGWLQLLHPDHLKRVGKEMQEAHAEERPWEDTFPLRGAHGEYRWFLSRAVPIHDESGKLVRWFGTNTDVTDLRTIEEQLVQAGQQKDEFLAMLGHELRNPLAAVRTAAELLKVQGESDPSFAKMPQIIERQTAHMAALLDGLLDVARMIRGKINIKRDPLDLAVVCREVASDFLESVEAGHIEVISSIPDEPVQVRGDRVRLTQIIGNLLANALKYTPRGGTVSVKLAREDGAAVVRVSDTGVGITQELLPHVFEAFRQGEQTIERSQGGLGLGLALVKNLTELHGGTVEARSEGEGRGAELIVRIPLSVTTSSNPPVSNRGPGASLRLVLIEDNEDSAEMLQQMLELSGHTVNIANHGRAGIELMRNLAPDATVCDLGLPHGMSGFDVAEEVRRDERLRGIKLIALSGYGRPEDKARSAEAGFDVHLTKPVDVRTLERVLRELTGAAGA